MHALSSCVSLLYLFMLIMLLGCETTATKVPIPGGASGDERQGPARMGDGPDLSAAEWDAERIHNGNGITYLVVADFPCPVSVSAHAAFRGAGTIKDVQPSPDGSLLAIRTTNASHEIGWLYDPRFGDVRPVAFQYAGETKLAGWRADGKYVAFLERTPGPGDFLRLVDITERREYITEYGLEVGSQGADVDLPDDVMEARIEPAGWRGAHFVFSCDNERFRIDPEAEVLENVE